jgi:hypothetical protein
MHASTPHDSVTTNRSHSGSHRPVAGVLCFMLTRQSRYSTRPSEQKQNLKARSSAAAPYAVSTSVTPYNYRYTPGTMQPNTVYQLIKQMHRTD